MRGLKPYCVSLLASGFLFCLNAHSFASSNSVGLVIMSDPHVDIKIDSFTTSTNINPHSGGSVDLDRVSYVALLHKIDEYMGTPSRYQAVIMLGDMPAHNAFVMSKVMTRSWESDVDWAFNHYFHTLEPDPLFFVFGNNDSPERDYGSVVYQGKSAYDVFAANNGKSGYLSTGVLCDFQKPFNVPCLIKEDIKEEIKDGYYSAYIGDHLKLISLNSVAFLAEAKADAIAVQELAWLRDELKLSKSHGDQVILAMHVPPQSNLWQAKYLKLTPKLEENTFENILKSYPGEVIGILAAHTHFDEIHAFKMTIPSSDPKKPPSVYVIPVIYSAGLVTDHGNASSFKTMSVTRVNNVWAIKNYKTFYFKGTKAEDKDTLPTFCYSFLDSYCSGYPDDTVAVCLAHQIEAGKTLAEDKFKDSAALKMKAHYTACNPNNHAEPHNPASDWLTSF